MKGIIALDIDGTVTLPGKAISKEVALFLKKLSDDWLIIFITGRHFKWCELALKGVDFFHYLAVQNGAILLEMPSKKIIAKKYLDQSILPIMQEICEGEPTDFVVYAGAEYDDLCFYRPNHFSKELLNYIKARSKTYKEEWREVSSFEMAELQEFASVKCFGLHEGALKVAKDIEKRLNLHVPLIKDPFNLNYYVAQATHREVSKGQSLKDLVKKLGNSCLVIAAGDDYNDESMFNVAHVKVVMETAPKEILKNADIIAPSIEKNGIITGLLNAIKKI